LSAGAAGAWFEPGEQQPDRNAETPLSSRIFWASADSTIDKKEGIE
jgi:hypothetical protein